MPTAPRTGRGFERLLATVLLTVFSSAMTAAGDPDAAPTTLPATAAAVALSDRQVFEELDLDRPGLGAVRRAVGAGDLDTAKRELAGYYRGRRSFYEGLIPFSPALPFLNDQLTNAATPLLERTGNYAPEYWLANGQLDLRRAPIHFRERFYFWESLGRLYASSHDERIAKAWVNLLDAYVDQVPYAPDDAYWRTMHVGIQLRSAFPVAFRSFLTSPNFTDQEVFRFLKRTLEQTRYLREHHNLTSNQLTFEMAGLYTSGVMYPEFKRAGDWRRFAVDTAVADLRAGWLPDGMTIELSPGYGQFFSNYYVIHDLAKSSGHMDDGDVPALVTATEPLYELYVKVMTPDRLTPATNDNDPVNVPKLMEKAIERFPDDATFRWAASDGKRGTPPSYTSLALPYAGFAAMRSSWARDANMLYFDFGPLGYRHAHQDKLEVLLWSYGRQILFDSGRGHYGESPARFQNYALDTFSHSTVLVDHRPQRRRWYVDPHPRNMPYKPLTDYTWDSTPSADYAAGVYAEAYGPPGETDADPYKDGSNFTQGWTHPATHHRRVLFYKPDLFVVADTLVPNDDRPHTYDARWQLASTRTRIGQDARRITTTDDGQPNIEIVPLDSSADLTVKATSAQTDPELLGWNAADKPRPATTVQHLKTGPGAVHFLTLLLPLKTGQPTLLARVKPLAEGSSYDIELRDGRRFVLQAPADPSAKLVFTPRTETRGDGRR